ncbi:molybdenum cofactor biosynthesis protein MoaE [Asticcacaulis solisilvae]|uniref:molybdenum cofactor biosynthesis protein MoaE n=1 Tax=Asticcacaulis solisilvae TaxID=1217274 RepID=UPI003FD7E0BA
MAAVDIRLLEDALDLAAASAEFTATHGTVGAVATFAGMVRSEAGAVDHLYLDWYPGMTEASFAEIADAAVARFDISAIAVHHRCGRVEAGQAIVFVAAASRHRRAALNAVDYAMDRLKSEAALWKREGGPGGERWVEPRAEDKKDLERWTDE